ncbi:MAG TPA: HD domain-containing protein [Candidatus Hydrogenedentes bacterium]|nr:HD domain-containing protein [Candidatus Hydrogenedentota bacterium]
MTESERAGQAVRLESGKVYRPIPLAALRLDTITDFDLYLATPEERAPVLYRRRDLPFTQEVQERLLQTNLVSLYVDVGEEEQYRRYVEGNLGAILADPEIGMAEKSAVLYASAQGLVKDLLEAPRAGDAVVRSKALVEHAVQHLFAEQTAFEHLLKAASYDYYTYTHSVNVFVFSIALAQRAGYGDSPALRSFGHGALLHDIGKSQIDPAIVNCRGKLSHAQWQAMKQHPVYGCEILREHGRLSERALEVVRHHHEKLDGSGYPDGLSKGDLSREVRIATICDIFDALTTRRPYKGAVDSFPALRLMKEEFDGQLDPGLFRAFVELMGNPSG